MSTSQGNTLYSGYDGTKETPKPSSTPQSGTDYSSVHNPYSVSYANRTGWDSFVESLGFTSPYQKYEMERKRNEELWNSSQEELIRQEKYNSAEEQVEREREAGLNSDLNGNVTSGDASEQTPLPIGDEHAAIQNMNEGLSTATNIVVQGVKGIADITSACVSGAISVAEKLESLSGTRLENQDKVIDLVTKYVDNSDAIGSLVKDASADDFDDEGNILLPEAVKTELSEMLKGIPRRYRKFAIQYQNKYINSLAHTIKRGEALDKASDAVVKGNAAQGFLEGTRYNSLYQTFDNLNPLLSAAVNAQQRMYSLVYSTNLKEFLNKDGKLDVEALQLYVSRVNGQVEKTRKFFDDKALSTIDTLCSDSDWKKRIFGIGLKAAWVIGDKVHTTQSRILDKASNLISAVK